MVNLEALKRFLLEVHIKKYNFDKKTPLAPSRFGSTEYRFRDSNFSYVDSYEGNRRRIGREIVSTGILKSEAIWGMNYYACILDEEFKSDVVFDFLKKALLAGIEKGIPLRGPDQPFEEGPFLYECRMGSAVEDDSLDIFEGVEKIYHNGALIYEATFHGGLVENDNF